MLLEICVDDIDGLDAAIAGGADRIELCAALALGGLTPTPGLMHHAATAPVPIHTLVRPRAGDFVYCEREVSTMLADIDAVRQHGHAGVVFGANCPDGRLDEEVLRRLLAHSEGLTATLHRAFDLVPDAVEAIETAIELGFERILTSGRASSAITGVEALAELVVRARGRIAIMPASGISRHNVFAMLGLDVCEIHASGQVNHVPISATAVDFGFDSVTRRVTSRDEVYGLKTVLDQAVLHSSIG